MVILEGTYSHQYTTQNMLPSMVKGAKMKNFLGNTTFYFMYMKVVRKNVSKYKHIVWSCSNYIDLQDFVINLI